MFLIGIGLWLLAVSLPSSYARRRVAASGPARRDPRSCSFSASSRSCWDGQHDVYTDVDVSFPSTGCTVHYDLEVTNTTCNPDGSGERTCLLVNGQFPGPTLQARWGDTLSVRVINSMQHNGTSIHFHGVRQLNSPGSDGVSGITQCAIAPGDSAMYSFQVTQHGSSWYHSHSSVQYGDGVFGPIVFEGPAAENYDTDLGPYVLSDIYGTQTAWQAGALSQVDLMQLKAPPLWTNLLINGTAVSANGAGRHNTVHVRKGKKYRLRLINSAMVAYIQVSLDRHSMLVIAADFVPVQPYTTQWLLLGVGQRYDVIITADQDGGSYWFRANVPVGCFGDLSPANGTAIWTYEAAKATVPTSAANLDEPSGCADASFTPLWKGNVPPATFDDTLNVNITNATVTPDGQSMVVWALNRPIWTNYSDPTLGYVMRHESSYPVLYNTIDAQPGGKWNYWLITNYIAGGVPHPIHLHGHNFYVIGSGAGSFNQTQAVLEWKAPVRRDTQSVPGSGWLAVAFQSNNPGTWLMHCHIAFHISEGFGMQYIEAPNMTTLPQAAQYEETCHNWNRYQATAVYHQDDSGL